MRCLIPTVFAVVLALLVPHVALSSPPGRDFARPGQPERTDSLDRTGFIVGLRGGLSAAGVFASDPILVATSPSFVETRDARTFALGIPVGTTLGWGITQDLALTFESVFAPIVVGGDVSIRPNLVCSYQIVPGIVLRGGVGITVIEAFVDYEIEQIAGPGERRLAVEGQEQIDGVALSVLIGVGYELGLTDYLALAIDFDGVFGVLSLDSPPESRLQDALSEGAELTAGLRFFF